MRKTTIATASQEQRKSYVKKSKATRKATTRAQMDYLNQLKSRATDYIIKSSNDKLSYAVYAWKSNKLSNKDTKNLESVLVSLNKL